MAGNTQKRISKEFAEVSQNTPPGMQVSLLDESNLLNWEIILSGPQGSPYAGGKFTLLLTLPPEYPFKPPKLSFKTRIYHPNVTFDEKGSMCIGILKPDAWKPSARIINVLMATQQMLIEPSLDDAVETALADRYKNNLKEFNEEAARATQKYATKK
ncbi:Ubiquitin-conjugating enzyme E2 14 [Golovinomyces cichoracearum]|uniref:E2 ubiquitin-conjugating enzyme n=1 Tax=Golovinomyces cichoracearum TaxID=62708 RepID=A0A420IG08_9PEZI|nr:Ubiquitin-conjugating enzyme E2 14 [Golovinomyces cichoracearum]